MPMTQQAAADRSSLPHACGAEQRPLVRPQGRSYVEAVASRFDDQKPTWFVSHAWIEPVVLFVRCLEEHCRLRHMPETTAFWICAYSNNQHALQSDIVPNPRETSFFRAMVECVGVLLILDKDLSPFSRIWCCFEASVVALAEEIVGRPVLWDIATVDRDGVAQILADGVTKEDLDNRHGLAGNEWNVKSEREQSFPFEDILAEALVIDVEKATSSMDVDRNRILNSIAGRDLSQLDDEPLVGHPAYSRVNARLHSMFAIAVWSQSLVEKHAKLLDQLVEALRDDTERKELRLYFQYSAEVDDRIMERLGSALPENLNHLALKLDECGRVGDAGVAALAEGFGQNLQILTVSLSHCPRFGDRGMAALAECLPCKVQMLSLNFEECSRIRGGGVAALAKGLYNLYDLKTLTLNCRGCDNIANGAVTCLAQHLATSLRLLNLNFMHCSKITDAEIAVLANILSQMQSLKTLELNFNCCGFLTEASAATLVAALPLSLDAATLHLRSTRVSRDVQRTCELLDSMRFWLQQLQEADALGRRNFPLKSAMVVSLDDGGAIGPARPATPQHRVALATPSVRTFPSVHGAGRRQDCAQAGELCPLDAVVTPSMNEKELVLPPLELGQDGKLEDKVNVLGVPRKRASTPIMRTVTTPASERERRQSGAQSFRAKEHSTTDPDTAQTKPVAPVLSSIPPPSGGSSGSPRRMSAEMRRSARAAMAAKCLKRHTVHSL